MSTNQIGLIGLAVMGQNLARNIASHHFHIGVYNRTASVTEAFITQHANDYLSPYYDIKSFVASLQTPRKIIMMVKAGDPVDAVIGELKSHLQAGDVLIDAGNSYFEDTIRRGNELREHKIHFVGCGVSGGEYGALTGPSMMPGCDKEVFQLIAPIFHAISAYDFSGGKCISYLGTDGVGHFVKMVHNGIEYAIMQMIAEGYDIFRKVFHQTPSEIAGIFDRYQRGRLQSYLIDITSKVLRQRDTFHTDQFLIDYILDSAGAKGTGKRTSLEGINRSESVSTIIEATFARDLSQKQELKKHLSSLYAEIQVTSSEALETFIDKMEATLYLGIVSAYAQGIALIETTAKEKGRKLHLAEIARIWQGGCIIRAKLLHFLETNFRIHPDIDHIFALFGIVTAYEEGIDAYTDTLSFALKHRVPTPALSAGLEYFFLLTTGESSTNLIQAQRDYFGAHTYARRDREGVFHTDWDFEA